MLPLLILWEEYSTWHAAPKVRILTIRCELFYYPHLRTRVFDGVDLILTCVPAVQAPYPPPPTPTTLLVADGKLLPLWRLPTARNLTHPTMKHTFFVCPGTASCLHHGPHDHHPLLHHPDEKIHCYNASLKLPSSRKMLSSRGWEHTSCHHDVPAVIVPPSPYRCINPCMCMHQLFMIARRQHCRHLDCHPPPPPNSQHFGA